MELEFIGHAGFIIERKSCLLIMDPWLSESGAFHSSWFQFPQNHHLADPLIARIKKTASKAFIYISHEHRDHFDKLFLQRIVDVQPTIVIPDYKYGTLFEDLRALGFKKILKCMDGEESKLGKEFRITIYTDDNRLNRDSAILVNDGTSKFLNMNDCKIHDRLAQIKQHEGHIDVFSCQFSGASWHPVSYSYSDKSYTEISRQKKNSKFIAVQNVINNLSPGTYLPAAGPVCFLHPGLFHLNLEDENIFPDQNEFLAYLSGKIRNTLTTNLMPGDIYNAATLSFTKKVEPRINTQKESLKALQSYRRIYNSKHFNHSPAMEMSIESAIESLEKNLQTKLKNFQPKAPPEPAIFYTIMGVSDTTICIDFATRGITRSRLSSSDFPEPYYRVDIPSDLVRELVFERMNWEELALSLRLRLTRRPNNYDQLIELFLIADSNLIGKILSDFESQSLTNEKILVSCSGKTFEIDKYYPHQGAKLEYGWDDEGFWVCPKHRWKYNLSTGNCDHSNLKISSKLIDEQ